MVRKVQATQLNVWIARHPTSWPIAINLRTWLWDNVEYLLEVEKKANFVSQCFAKSKCNLCPQKHHLLLHSAALDCVDPPCQSQDQVKVTANMMIGKGSTCSSGQNKDHVRVSANLTTANGGTTTAFTCDQTISEVLTISYSTFCQVCILQGVQFDSVQFA